MLQCHVGFARPSQLKVHDAMSMPGDLAQTGLNQHFGGHQAIVILEGTVNHEILMGS